MTDLKQKIEEILIEHENHSPIYTCRLQITDQILSELRKWIESRKIITPSGKCPSCNNPNILGMHPVDSDEHYRFYNQALNDLLEEVKL
jgi:hypothetical protein